MFNRKDREPTQLEKAREEALSALRGMEETSDEYATAIAHVKTLSDLIVNETNEKLNPNTLVMALANIGGILAIVAYEQKHIFGSKAASFIGKIR